MYQYPVLPNFASTNKKSPSQSTVHKTYTLHSKPYTRRALQVRDGAYPNDNFFGSKPAGLNPFAKNTNYSKPITDYSKDPSYVE